MKKINSYEKFLLSVTLILCSIIIGYNAFFVSAPTMPCLVQSDISPSSKTFDKSALGPGNEIISTSDENDKGNASNPTNKVNINTASAEELVENIKGVGPKTAERIIKYRSESGGFKDISDIMNVKGIGEKTFEKIKDSICVD